MSTYQLREMSVGEILDATFGLYRNNFAVLVSIAVICVGAPTLMYIYVALAGGPGEYLTMWFAAALLQAIGGLVALGATVWAISEIYLGREPVIGDALSFALTKMGRVLIAGLVKYLLVAIGMVFLVIPGIVIACGYAVVVQTVVLEDLRSGTDGLGRSWNLTRGYKGKAFVLGLTVFLLIYIPLGVAQTIASIMTGFAPWVEAMGQVVWIIVYPLLPCALTLFYYDLRVRQEAFDLEILSHTMEHAVER